MATKKKRPHSSSSVLGPVQSPRISLTKVPSVPSLAVSNLDNASGDAKSHVFCREHCEEIEELKEKLAEAQAEYNKLYFINEQANIDLAHERHRVGQLERKLGFIKENQHIFEKLKEAYLSVRYNETTAGRKLVEIRDKGIQTWEGIVCQACLGTEKLRAELERIQASQKDCLLIKKEELWKLTETVAKLRSYAQDVENKYSKKEGIIEDIAGANVEGTEEENAGILRLCITEAIKSDGQGIVSEETDARKGNSHAVKAKVKEFEQKTAALLEFSTSKIILRRISNQANYLIKENKDKLAKKGNNENTEKKEDNDSTEKNEDNDNTEKKEDNDNTEKKEDNDNIKRKEDNDNTEKKESKVQDQNAIKTESEDKEEKSEDAEMRNENEIIVTTENIVGVISPTAEEVNAEYNRHLQRLMEYGVMLRNLAKAPKSLMHFKRSTV